MYKDFYIESLREATEILEWVWRGCACSWQVDELRRRKRGSLGLLGRSTPYGCLLVTGVRRDGYPRGVPWLWSCGTRCGLVRLGGRRACRRGRSPGLERIAPLAGFAR